MAQLNGEGKIKYWRPSEVGDTKVRIVPWDEKKTAEGMPFVERFFYYIGNKRILSPKQFGDYDYVDELVTQLWQSGEKSDKEIAKKLMPKLTTYALILVKGEEDKGVQLWSLNKDLAKRLFSFYLNDEIGDISDPENGFDLTVTASNSGKMYEGKPVLDLVVDAARKSSPLSKWFGGDSEKVDKLFSKALEVDIDDVLSHYKKSTEEIKRMLDAWVAGGDAGDDKTEGTTRGKEATDKLTELENEVSSKKVEKKQLIDERVTEKVPPEKVSAKKRKAESVEDVDAPQDAKKAIDDALNDLLEDD
jgi:hypothetical protein